MKKIINLLFLFTILVVTSCETPVNTGTIHGVVTDYATGEPIKNAGVTIMPIGNTTITGSEGQFQFDNLEPRTYQLMIQKTGYEILTTTNLQLSLGAIIPQNLQMTVMPPSLKVLDDKGNPIDTLFFDATLADDNIRLFNILNDGVEDLNWDVLSNSKWIKSIKPQSGVLKTTETVGIVVETDRSLITNTAGEESTIHVVTDNGSKEIKLSLGNEYEKYKEYLKQIEEYKSFPTLISFGKTYKFLPKELTNEEINWKEAISRCESISFAGYEDWILPDFNIVYAMLDDKYITGEFSYTDFWTFTKIDQDHVYSVPYNGGWNYNKWNEKGRVRCVRVEEDNTLKDYNNLKSFTYNKSNYKILPEGLTEVCTWSIAKDVCKSITYGGYEDWYIPSKDELNFMYNINLIPSIGSYWSSTKHDAFEGRERVWYLSNGYWYGSSCDEDYYNEDTYRPICVRKD